MSQGTYAGLHLLEDFLWADADALEAAIADAAPEHIRQVTVGGINSALTVAATTDEPGGIVSIDVTDDVADDGFAMYAAPMRPSDGAAVIEVRFKTGDISLTNIFFGFMESLTPTDPDQGVPFTQATTVTTIVNLGVTASIGFDQNATNTDYHFVAAQDATAASGIDLTDPPVGGGRAGVDLSDAGSDNTWIVGRVEIEQDGTAFGYVGDTQTDALGGGEGLDLLWQTDRGALDATAMVFPYLIINNNTTTGTTSEVDYFAIRGDRDWTV